MIIAIGDTGASRDERQEMMMSHKITVDSTPLGPLQFWCSEDPEASGYVHVWINGQARQIFRASGAAEIARDERTLREVADRYIKSREPADWHDDV